MEDDVASLGCLVVRGCHIYLYFCYPEVVEEGQFLSICDVYFGGSRWEFFSFIWTLFTSSVGIRPHAGWICPRADGGLKKRVGLWP